MRGWPELPGPAAIAADLAHRANYAKTHRPMGIELGLTAERICIVLEELKKDPEKCKKLGFSYDLKHGELRFRKYVIVDVDELARARAAERAA